MDKEAQKTMELLTNGTAETFPADSLAETVESAYERKKPLSIKIGIDPTTPNVHIGHMVPFLRIRKLQDLGHRCRLVIGDMTARIGDPTGESAERPRLSAEDTAENSSTYSMQIFRILDPEKTEVHRQSTWYGRWGIAEIIEWSSKLGLGWMLSHETYRSRLESGKRLGLHELLYPLFQAYDSVFLKPDIEFGGTDQRFNILCGRELMKSAGLDPQAVVLLPLLPGTDGEKMSKSKGNDIRLNDTPADIFGKVMSIPDSRMEAYARLLLTGNREGESVLHNMKDDPMKAKKTLAFGVTRLFCSEETAGEAEEHFNRTVVKKEPPGEIPRVLYVPGTAITDILVDSGCSSSKSEARRLISGGGVSIDLKKILDPGYIVGEKDSGSVIKAGKRRYLRLEIE